jgi:hypothetical protein
VKSNEDEYFLASPSQGEEANQGIVEALEVSLTNEESSCLMEVGESGESN